MRVEILDQDCNLILGNCHEHKEEGIGAWYVTPRRFSDDGWAYHGKVDILYDKWHVM